MIICTNFCTFLDNKTRIKTEGQQHDVDMKVEDVKDTPDMDKLYSSSTNNNGPKKYKRVKIEEGEELVPPTPTIDPEKERLTTIAIQQALQYERELQHMRLNRGSVSKEHMKKALVRPAIGSSGYGRFLCSHYNPGTTFISYLNGLSQKIEMKQRKKEMQLKEEQENIAKKEEEKTKKTDQDAANPDSKVNEESKTDANVNNEEIKVGSNDGLANGSNSNQSTYFSLTFLLYRHKRFFRTWVDEPEIWELRSPECYTKAAQRDRI